jgi:hypothetical protein
MLSAELAAAGGEAPRMDAGVAAGLGEAGPPPSSYRVLLVDDDPATLMAMKHHLVRMGGKVKYEGAKLN